jgi:DNA-binding transcriptional LysR family regulator
MLGMTTPAVSQLVHRLERELDVALFERTTHGLRSTPAGLILRERARALIVSESDALHELQTYRGQLIPTLRLYMMDSIAVHLMNAIAPELTPVVRKLEVLSGRSLTHTGDFLTGAIDIIITSDEFAGISRLDRYRLCQQDLIAVLPATVPQDRRDLVSLSETLPLIRFRESSNIDQDIDTYLKSQGLAPPRTIECGSPATILEVVAGGHGWTIAPPLVLSWFRHLWEHQAWMALPPPPVSQTLYLIAHAEKFLDLPKILAQKCRAALRQEMQAWRGTPAEPGLSAVRVDDEG